MEEYKVEEEQEEAKSDQVKRWFQDNLRIVISIIIVVLIAGGIYSYSKRTTAPSVSDQSVSTDNGGATAQPSNTGTPAANQQAAPAATPASAAPAGSSQETDTSFIETAVKGNSATVLARRALADYLEKNPDSQLTKEHKIYIEDYLRKNVQPGTHVRVGTSMEFSKDTIAKAITASKTLTPSQLNNLKKYSARVTSLQ